MNEGYVNSNECLTIFIPLKKTKKKYIDTLFYFNHKKCYINVYVYLFSVLMISYDGKRVIGNCD